MIFCWYQYTGSTPAHLFQVRGTHILVETTGYLLTDYPCTWASCGHFAYINNFTWDKESNLLVSFSTITETSTRYTGTGRRRIKIPITKAVSMVDYGTSTWYQVPGRVYLVPGPAHLYLLCKGHHGTSSPSTWYHITDTR